MWSPWKQSKSRSVKGKVELQNLHTGFREKRNDLRKEFEETADTVNGQSKKKSKDWRLNYRT